MKQKINIKKIIEEHSDTIVVGVSGVSIIVAYALGHKIGRGVGEADCNRLWNEICDAAGVDRMMALQCNNRKMDKNLVTKRSPNKGSFFLS